MSGAEYVWGDELMTGGRPTADTWQGDFPYRNTLEDGFKYTAPVGSFPASGYGLFDMAGRLVPGARMVRTRSGHDIPRKVTKGGSHLCARTTAAAISPPRGWRNRSIPPGFRCILRE